MNPAQDKPAPPQLQMLWPKERLASPPVPNVPAEYTLRTYRPQDKDAYLKLMAEAGFATFNEDLLNAGLLRVLPKGLFVVEHKKTDQLAATTMATHNPIPEHPFGGELGWVAGSPAHSGKGLGKAVCAAVTARFISAGYDRIYLKTDDWRLPAIKVYFQLGYAPFLYAEGMEERWKAVCGALKFPFCPAAGP
jgi:mycothiol synthase